MGRMGKFLILSLEGVCDRDAAESLRQHEVYGPAAALDRVRGDKIYPQDLIGMTVHTPGKRCLGVLQEVLHTGANDIWCVESETGVEYMLPGVRPFLKEIDLAARTLIFDPPEGLLEIYEAERGR